MSGRPIIASLRRRVARPPRLGLLVGGSGLLILAWVFANPPGAAPDEPAHMLKALAASEGDFLGEPAPPIVSSGDAVRDELAQGNRVLSASAVVAYVFVGWLFRCCPRLLGSTVARWPGEARTSTRESACSAS